MSWTKENCTTAREKTPKKPKLEIHIWTLWEGDEGFFSRSLGRVVGE